jgi:hypothetical protein
MNLLLQDQDHAQTLHHRKNFMISLVCKRSAGSIEPESESQNPISGLDLNILGWGLRQKGFLMIRLV